MPGRAVGGGIVENDQRIDGDAGPGIDQKWIDVDRRDPAAGVCHEVGQADQGLDGGGLVQRRPAAITFQLHAGFGPGDQVPGLGRIQRRAGQRDVLHQLDIDATGKTGRPAFPRLPPKPDMPRTFQIDANDPERTLDPLGPAAKIAYAQVASEQDGP
jgi:hypothetical protein